MHICSVIIYYTLSATGSKRNSYSQIAARNYISQIRASSWRLAPKSQCCCTYYSASRSGRFPNWTRSTITIDWQYSGGLKLLLGEVGQSWLCEVIANGPWKGGEGEGAGGFETELWMGEVRGGGGWITFMFRGKCQGVLGPEERKGIRLMLVSRKETQPPPVSRVGHSWKVRLGKPGGSSFEYLMDEPQ